MGSSLRRTILVALAALVALVALGTAVVASSGGADNSTVTRARLERSLPVVFANIYADQARLLGHPGITPASLQAKAMCDKGGAQGADVGPGGDWVCLMSWTDPNMPMPPEGYGKFELNVHSNDCYTAGGPTKLTGFLTLTDTHGNEVTNPAFEFDGCFDPNGANTPTGNSFPSVLGVTSTALTPDARRKVTFQMTCGTGSHGCSGTVTAAAGATSLGTVPFNLAEESTVNLAIPGVVPAGAKQVTFQVTTSDAVGPSGPVTLPVG